MNDDPTSGNFLAPIKRFFYRLFKKPDNREEFIEQIHEAEEHSVLNADAVSMMEGILQISDLAVRDIMVPRARMDCIEIDTNIDEILDFVTEIAHSRFPVIEGRKDNVIGIILAKDILSILHRDEENIRGLMRPAVLVPESKKLNAMLRDFRIKRNHMAIVVDEYGGISGLITIEDVLEQIVGDIEDEHDTDEATTVCWWEPAPSPVIDIDIHFGSGSSCWTPVDHHHWWFGGGWHWHHHASTCHSFGWGFLCWSRRSVLVCLRYLSSLARLTNKSYCSGLRPLSTT